MNSTCGHALALSALLQGITGHSPVAPTIVGSSSTDELIMTPEALSPPTAPACSTRGTSGQAKGTEEIMAASRAAARQYRELRDCEGDNVGILVACCNVCINCC
jgi:hypothetical protein